MDMDKENIDQSATHEGLLEKGSLYVELYNSQFDPV